MAGSTVGQAFAVVRLSYDAKAILPGERVDHLLPADVLEACIERGEVSRTKPKA